MELLLPDVDPHVFRADHHIGIPCKSQTSRIESLCHLLVRYGDIEMLHAENVPNVLGCTIESLLHTRRSPFSPVRLVETTTYCWVTVAMWGDYTITRQFRSGKNESRDGMVGSLSRLYKECAHERNTNDRNY